MIWNKARECMSRDELAVLQGRRLVKLVRKMYYSAEYYQKKMKKLGLEPGDIRGIEDLEKLPFTTREDLMEAYPLGVFAMSDSRIVRYRTSDQSVGCHAGIETGIETIAGYTHNDIESWKECMARSISMAGLGERDIIQAVYSGRMGIDGLDAHYGAEKIGAAVISTPDDRPAALIALLRRLHVTGMISTPSNLLRVAQMVEERGLKDRLQLKAAICAGEPWTESIRSKIQDQLGIRLYDIFGLNELTGLGVACECACQKGMHIQEDFFLTEILEPHTLLVLPGGNRGELVFTTLQKEGIPLIRYRTMLITKINYEKCECGRTLARMDRISEKADDILMIRGNSVFASRIEAALSGLQDIEASYIIYIRKKHNLDVVDIYIEGDETESKNKNRTDIKHQVADAVCNAIGMMPKVHYARNFTKNSIENLAGQKVTIVDERKY